MMLFGDSSPPSAHWEPGPNTRGSIDIFLSCLVTLGLCVWTSVHLNLPARGEDKPRKWWDPRGWISKQKWRKIAWLLVGIFAPEFIAFTAYAQWRAARKLTKEMQELLSGQKRCIPCQSAGNETNDVELETVPADTLSRTHPWTLTHSFYAVMGGFVFDFSNLPEDEQFMPDSAQRRTIVPRALQEIATYSPSAIPDISTSYIRDKSNADGLAKAIVCVQATWFATQCVVRLAARLPISLFELNTLAHCLCTLLIYAFWWSKPLDIEDASSVSDPETYGLFAAMYVRCYEDDLYLDTERTRQNIAEYRDRWHHVYAPQPVSFAVKLRAHHLVPTSGLGVLLPGQTVEGLIYLPSGCCGRAHSARCGVLGHRTQYRLCSPQDYRRWALASSYMKPLGDEHRDHHRISMPDRMRDIPDVSETLFIEPTFYGISYATARIIHEDTSLLVTLILTGALYGGLHLLAWDAPFTSRVQCILWRVSGLTVAAAGCAFVLEALAFSLVHSALKWILFRPNGISVSLYAWSIRPKGYFFKFEAPERIVFYSSRLLYVLARLYLFVESLYAFAYLPPGVFQQPQWTYYFPHIS